MNVPTWVWLATLAGYVAMIVGDLVVVGRNPREPSPRECAAWIVGYLGLGGVFAAGLLLVAGRSRAGEFLAGWVTEYSLSVDNLFVFLIVMSRFAVPRQLQQRVLLTGIVLALLMRGVFIAAGAAVVSRFSTVFYLFGAFLIYTAVKLARHGEDGTDDFQENRLIRWSRRVLPITAEHHGARLTIRVAGRRLFTPMLIVMIAIGTTDLIFAFDSIPAIFGLTQEPYLVFAANVFAMMGLRQLYFLLGGVLDRLRYFGLGLSVALGFIGGKLLLDALRTNSLPFVNGGRPVAWAPEVPIAVSLAVIVTTLTTAAAASAIRSGYHRRRVPS